MALDTDVPESTMGCQEV